MQVTLDTDKTLTWLKLHLNGAIPSLLLFCSWFAMHAAINSSEKAEILWWSCVCFLSGAGGILLLARYIALLLDIHNQ
jgi:hypothetical protein